MQHATKASGGNVTGSKLFTRSDPTRLPNVLKIKIR